MTTKDHFWVDYPKSHKDEVQLGDIVIFKDPSYKEEWNRILYGNVVSLPALSNRLSHLEGKVNIGERIYFKYNVAVSENIYHENGKRFLKVHVEDVFCFIRGGIKTYNDVILCQAIWDEHEEVEVDGKKLRVKTKGELVVGFDIKYDKRLTIIKHSDSEYFSDGDKVMMDKFCDEKYEIEGKEYFVMREENVLCKVD
jgi:co-chaperonin GroES (HSP10)